jgi:hypothetical protein
VADLLKKELGVQVSETKGSFREFSVLVDEKIIAKRKWFRMPKDEDVVSAVKQAVAA